MVPLIACSNLATIYCDCTGRKIFLCDACISSHRTKRPYLMHRLMGIEVAAPSDVYQHRCAEFIKRKAELQGFVSKLDECEVEFGRTAEELVRAIQTYRENQLTQLRQWKQQIASDIEYCVREVEVTLGQDQAVLQGNYSYYLRGLQTDCPVYFDFIVDTDTIYNSIKTVLCLKWENPKLSSKVSPNQANVMQQASPQAYIPQAVQPQGNMYHQGQHLTPTPGPIFQTVQPSVPAPVAAQCPEAHSSMAGSMAGAPSIKACEACRKPFTDYTPSNRYCSLQCSQQASQPKAQSSFFRPQQSLPGYAKKCEFCSNMVTASLTNIPDQLERLRSFAQSVCSVECLAKFQQTMPAKRISCAGCTVTVDKNNDSVIKLPCGSFFHNTECLLIYMQKCSRGFTVPMSSYNCPQCEVAFSFLDVSRYISKSEWDVWQECVQKSRCCLCGEPALCKKTLGCGHIACDQHKYGSGQRCCYCNSYQPFR